MAIDITTSAISNDKRQFMDFVQKCDYYAVTLPKSKDGQLWFALFSGDIKTNIRIIRAEDLSMFMKSHKIIIQNGDNIVMNWDGE